MLLEFSVENFLSIASRECLSMNAGRFKSTRIGAVLDTKSKIAPNVLRSMAVMGANGAGKSTIFHALEFVQDFVRFSAQSMQLGDDIHVAPFKLDNELKNGASHFEVVFLCGSTEYAYSFSADTKRVLEERLTARKNKKPTHEVFSRKFEGKDYIWNIINLPKEQASLWKNSTRPNALFISTAVHLNSIDLIEPFEWLTDTLRIQTTSNNIFSPGQTAHLIKDHVEDGCKKAILNILREADLGIRDISIDTKKFEPSMLPLEMPDNVRNDIEKEMSGQVMHTPKFIHRSLQSEDILFDINEESNGTKRLFEMAGQLISAIQHNLVLVVDELEESLHPYILRMIVNMFQNPDTSDSRAQLVFSTHNTDILDSNILDRDQFYFVEKRRGQSKLIRLNDYKPRKGEALRSNYLKGRYGGVPSIPQTVSQFE